MYIYIYIYIIMYIIPIGKLWQDMGKSWFTHGFRGCFMCFPYIFWEDERKSRDGVKRFSHDCDQQLIWFDMFWPILTNKSGLRNNEYFSFIHPAMGHEPRERLWFYGCCMLWLKALTPSTAHCTSPKRTARKCLVGMKFWSLQIYKTNSSFSFIGNPKW